MKGGKQLGQTVQQSRISIERRANMLGQHLTNQGFKKVRVKGKITIECADDEGAKGVQTIEVGFSDFVEGAGPAEIGGDGRVSLGDKADDTGSDATDGQPATTGALPAPRVKTVRTDTAPAGTGKPGVFDT